ncbi:YkgJ family cysteine cluster protein [Tissierella sp.]|uniref:YkgJ family cysteine cluster protein n=1 Tax=Tissierella sp. TaxID=41274 RepID=UPI0028668B84|nr:YkgJ family cysteine cluster protein [Tissierella sp.]MDR7856027.1 YkgJ family cysteine cluster protein [Tissierella sp.]
MYDLLNIPKHKNCSNCGECCGPVPANKKEIENIKKYLKDNPELMNQLGEVRSLTCMLRDEEEKKCLIYPVRPLVCRLMGVAEGLVCSKGNSSDIDGVKFLNESFTDKPELLNFVRWGE